MSFHRIAVFIFVLTMTFAARGDFKSFYFQKMMGGQQFADAETPEVKSGVFVQKIDHRNPEDKGTFTQRYYFNTQYASGENAPVLFYLCGEATCEPTSLKGSIESHAKELKAALVSLEHRYYGKSQPFEKLSAENLKLLTIDQALEDAAAFQKDVAAKLNLKGKWIVVGGSYPGSLAAYYRARFPELVVGALASSGPVMAKENFEEYDLHVAKVAGPECLVNIKKVVGEVEKALLNAEESKKVRALFEAEALTDDDDFLYLVADMGALAVQYGYRDRFCGLLGGESALEGYAQFTREIFGLWQMNALSGSAAGALSEDPNDYIAVFGMRQWFYQSCTEYGYWQNAYHDEKMSARSRRINPEYHRNICKRLFKMDAPVPEETTNKAFYFPLLESGVSQIFFTNGSRDPWMNLSIAGENGNDKNPNVTLMTLKDAAHCDDLRAPKTGDLESVKNARAKFLQLAKGWLGLE